MNNILDITCDELQRKSCSKMSKNIFCLLQNTTICALKFTVWCKHIFINNKQNRWAAEKTFYPHGLIKNINSNFKMGRLLFQWMFSQPGNGV